MVRRILIPATLIYSVMSCTDKEREQPHHVHIVGLGPNYADSVNTGIIVHDTLKGSLIRIAMNFIGSNHIHIEYGSPGVRSRVIWGGLVAFDQVWLAGAHNATSIEFSRDVLISETKVKAGRYAFFAIPGRETWTLILNRNWDQHLADEYNPSEDVVRLNVKPEIFDTVTQRLTYAVHQVDAHNGEITMQWEKIRITLPFKNVKK